RQVAQAQRRDLEVAAVEGGAKLRRGFEQLARPKRTFTARGRVRPRTEPTDARAQRLVVIEGRPRETLAPGQAAQLLNIQELLLPLGGQHRLEAPRATGELDRGADGLQRRTDRT